VVDNFSTHNVRLQLDGKEWLTCSRDSTHDVQLPAGNHELVVLDMVDGQELDRRTLTVVAANTYVLNVLGAQNYRKGKVWYNDPNDPFLFPPDNRSEDQLINLTWFSVKVDYLFKDPPLFITESIPESQKGHTRANVEKTYLHRAGRQAGEPQEPEAGK
jgi:hypothetical protein